MARRVNIQSLVDEETAEKLKAAAEQDNRSVSDYVRIIIEQHLANK